MKTFDLLGLIFPKHCVGCDQLGSYLCHLCRQQIQYYDYPLCPGCSRSLPWLGVHKECVNTTNLSGLVAVGHHLGILKKLVQKIKYSNLFDMVPVAGELMLEHLPLALHANLIVTSIPLHVSRQRQRGFNQSELLAKDLARKLHLPYRTLLEKVKVTKPQAELNREQRLKNLNHAFASISTPPHRILLVDDVATTRSTLNQAALVLKRAGAKEVFGLVLAHGK